MSAIKKYFFKLKPVLIISFLALTLFISFPKAVFGINTIDEGWRVIQNSTVLINIWGIGKSVINNSAFDIFVPTRAVSEWNAFISNKPASITVNPISRRVFLTHTSINGNMGGLAGADALCAAEASAAGLSGTYKAWLSDDSTSAASRLTHSSYPYKEVDGTLIANNWDDLVDGGLQAPINKDATGANSGSINSFVWTGSNPDGSITGTSCTNWTYQYNGCGTNCQGMVGISFTYEYPSQWTVFGPTGCSQGGAGIYCLEQ